MIRHPDFSHTPAFAQFAKNGDWANAWQFPLTRLPGKAQIVEYLAGTTEVAFEALFGLAFFGARCVDRTAAVKDFAIRCVEAMRMACDGEAFFPSFEKSHGIQGLGQTMAFAEIGAVNNWHANGPIVVDPSQHSVEAFEEVWQSVSAAPLAKDASNRKAIEFVYETPFAHWFALPVSSSTDPAHALSKSLLGDAYRYASGIDRR